MRLAWLAVMRSCVKASATSGMSCRERQTGVDVACALAGLLDQSGNIVAGQVEQALETLRLFVRMHVDALRIFDLSLVLQKLSMTSTTMDS